MPAKSRLCGLLLTSNYTLTSNHIGTAVAPLLKDFYKDKTVDLSSLYFDPEYEGLMDYVVVAGLVRSPMGVFQTLYASGVKRWNIPKEQDIADCLVAAIALFANSSLQSSEFASLYYIIIKIA